MANINTNVIITKYMAKHGQSPIIITKHHQLQFKKNSIYFSCSYILHIP